MTCLRIYGDEAGTMPVLDADKAFLVATVAKFGDHLLEGEVKYHKEAIFQALLSGGLLPNVGYVLPRAGYADALQARMDKLSTMARYTRLTTGTNAQYLTSTGFRVRNQIWSAVMLQVLGQAVAAGLALGPITEVQIYLDQKSMAKPARRYFTDLVKDLDSTVRQTIRNTKAKYPEEGRNLDIRAAFDKRSIHIHWSDQATCKGAEAGLLVAHHLAGIVLKEISAESFDPSCDQLGGRLVDLTGDVTRPPHPVAVASWKHHTGLPKPGL